MEAMAKEGQADFETSLEPMRSLWSCHNLTATSPVGADVCPLATSESVDLGTSRVSAISAKVIPLGPARSSAMRDRQTEDLRFPMGVSIRDPVRQMQRHPVTEFRHPRGMQLPTEFPGPNSHLGERIKFWRELRGLTRQRLGKLAGVAPTTLGTIEIQEQHSSTRIVQLASALEINAEYLATGEGNPYQNIQQVPPRKDWPDEFPPVQIVEPLDANERMLAGMKLKEFIDEIKARRPKRNRREG